VATAVDKPPGRWWLRMIVASAVLVALLLGAAFVAPAIPLHYCAWRYRRRCDRGQDLPRLAGELLRMRASRERVTRLLGPPGSEERRPDGRVALFYDVAGLFHDSLQGMNLVFDGGQLDAVEEVTGRDLITSAMSPFKTHSHRLRPPARALRPGGAPHVPATVTLDLSPPVKAEGDGDEAAGRRGRAANGCLQPEGPRKPGYRLITRIDELREDTIWVYPLKGLFKFRPHKPLDCDPNDEEKK
jgi:hypothetical protein